MVQASRLLEVTSFDSLRSVHFCIGKSSFRAYISPSPRQDKYSYATMQNDQSKEDQTQGVKVEMGVE